MKTSIPKAIKQLLQIVALLEETYKDKYKKFTLDGRLVGDLGEVLVESKYDLVLFDKIAHHHDAKTFDGKLVQIKATMKNSLTFPSRHTPDYYLGIKINEDGSFDEIFNGPGKIARMAIENRKQTIHNLYSISISALKKLNMNVNKKDRIPLRIRSGKKTAKSHCL